MPNNDVKYWDVEGQPVMTKPNKFVGKDIYVYLGGGKYNRVEDDIDGTFHYKRIEIDRERFDELVKAWDAR